MIQAPEGITLYWRKSVFIIILPNQLQALEQRIERKLTVYRHIARATILRSRSALA
jgi:hypothetical protein